ncbi:Hypothetical protein HDN1F_07870 [gamma proteobacterium HdN1]|nr:Hypothetical protein HDN1F_07870 [gamma proteobacterium HdN1]
MSTLIGLGSSLLIFLAMVLALIYGSALLQLRRVRWRTGPAYAPAAEMAATDAERQLAESAGNGLKAQGFEPAFWIQAQEPTRQDASILHVQVWIHPRYCAYAQIAPHPQPEHYQPTQLDFLTLYDSGKLLHTINGIQHFLGDSPKQWDLMDGYLPSLTAHWELHCQRMTQQLEAPCAMDVARFCELSNNGLNDYLQLQVQQGEMVDSGDGRYRVTWKGAWRMLRRQQVAAPKVRAMTQQMLQNQSGPPNPAADVLAHERYDAMTRGAHSGVASRLGLLLVSLLAFGISFGMQIDFTTVAILIGVLLVHELGHLLLMALFGFRDLQVLFIPFLGAVAMGRHSHCPAWKRALIDLAGPVPGLILAGTLWYTGAAGQSDFWMQATMLLLVLNYLNLLPIHPLDGGHLLQMLLMQRWPRLQVAFWAVSVAGFFALAWWMKSAVLAALGFLFAFTLLQQTREARILRHLRQSKPSLPADNRSLPALYTAMYDLKLPWKFAQRLQSARNLLQHLTIPSPSVRESLFGLSIYLVTLIGTPALVMWEMPELIHRFVPAANIETPDWDKRLAKARTHEERADILLQAGSYHYWIGESDISEHYFRQARTLLTDAGLAESPAMVRLLIDLASIRIEAESTHTETAASQAVEHLEQALILLDKLPVESGTLIQKARALEMKGDMTDAQEQPDMALALYAQALQLQQNDDNALPSDSNSLLLKLARIHLHQGNASQADALFERALQALENSGYEEQNVQWMTLKEYSAALSNQQRYADVLSAFDRYPIPDTEHSDYWYTQMLDIRAWALFSNGQTKEAAALYEQLASRYQSSKPAYRSKYALPDALAKLLVVQHVLAGGGNEVHPAPRADAFARLQQLLNDDDINIESYLEHLDCECKQNAGGYELQQSLDMRAAVQRYGGISHPDKINTPT